MSTDVEARHLGFLADAQADGDGNEHEKNEADDQRIGRAGADADELVQEAETHLTERVDYIMGRFRAINSGLQTGVERRTANLARERALLEGAGDPEAAERFESEQRQRADSCRERQAAYAAVLAELQSVLEGLDGAQGESRMG